jgi:hypothetical protein
MEGMDENFVNFLKFILAFAIVFYIAGFLKNDMASRGVFGVEKQRQILINKSQTRGGVYNNNPATVRYNW